MDKESWSLPASEPNEAWERPGLQSGQTSRDSGCRAVGRIFTGLDETAEMTFKEGITNKQFHEAAVLAAVEEFRLCLLATSSSHARQGSAVLRHAKVFNELVAALEQVYVCTLGEVFVGAVVR